MNVSIPRESVEFVEAKVTVDGVQVTAGVNIAVVAKGIRPVTFNAPFTLAGKIGILTVPVATATESDVWARIMSNPEFPVVYLGRLTRT